MTKFVGRNPDGSLYGVFAVQQWEGQERLADDHQDIISWFAPLTPDQLAQRHVSSIDRLQFDVLFNHENRIRALEGKGEVTPAQFRSALVERFKEINS